MKTKSIALQYLVAPFLGLLAGCSGGNISFEISGPDIEPFSTPWIDEAITSYGVNTSDGQVAVNGVAYWTSHATVTVNGRPGVLSDLRRGQVIMIKGNVNSGSFSGSADHIDYDARLIGPVQSLDGAEKRLVVMGQTVMTGPDTVFAAGIDPDTYSGISVGSNVEVSGFARAGGAILATRIDTIANNPDLQLIGQVSNLDFSRLWFTINDLTVDYSSALVINLPGGAPSDGMTVKIIGELAGGRFDVETLTTVRTVGGILGRRVRISGLVTHFPSPRQFRVNHDAVETDSNTEFLNGDQSDLGLNAKLVVDGIITLDDRISADRVTFDL